MPSNLSVVVTAITIASICPARADFYDALDKCVFLGSHKERVDCIDQAKIDTAAERNWFYTEVEDSMTDELTWVSSTTEANGRSALALICSPAVGKYVGMMIQLTEPEESGKMMLRFDDLKPITLEVSYGRLSEPNEPLDLQLINGLTTSKRLRVRSGSIYDFDFNITGASRILRLLSAHCSL